MRFTPQFLDEIRARLPVSHVVGRKVALKKAGRELKGLSPFKVERTPSFFVNDHKGFYHCFASGAHGDIFKFVMETEGLSFSEAVEQLAEEAGLPLPKAEPRSPQAREEADERTRLHEVLEASCRFFQEQLVSPAGQEARAYIAKRGLARETVAEFRLGFAPSGRNVLKEWLGARGHKLADMVASGMLIGGEDISVPYDRFRGRLMFPIQDLKGRIIAFGGRALEAGVPAKYLNSPETPLFHKGNNLFNAHRARKHAHDKGRVIAVEGYMDAIALAEAGFGETVAPLGTALTEPQVQLLWRMSAEPILCFDGDSAGRRAAFRAVETVLPHLKPGASVRFAFLPDGLDPDDLIRAQGPAAFEAVLATRVRPLFDVLVEKEELAGGDVITPEARAALEVRLRKLVGQIADQDVRQQYEAELRQTLWEKNRRQLREITGGGGERRTAAVAGRRRDNAKPDWKARERARLARPGDRRRAQPPAALAASASNELVERHLPVPPREALILATLLAHPWLIADEAERIAGLGFASESLSRLRDALLAASIEENCLDRENLASHVNDQGLAKVVALVLRAITHKGDKFADPEADRAAVETGWHHVVALHQRQGELRRALEAAEQAWHREGSEDAFARICELQATLGRSDGVEAPTALTTRGPDGPATVG